MSKVTPSNQTADLGNDPVGRLLVRLALPTITAQVVNLLYNIVDRIYIGRIPLEGKLALTGMGVTFPVITLISAFSALVGMGGAPRASIALGAGEKDRAERTLGTCAAALWSLAAVLTVLFLLFQRDLLRLFGASADTLPYAMQYLSIYVLGTIFVMTALGLNGFITAQGSSAVAMENRCHRRGAERRARPALYLCPAHGRARRGGRNRSLAGGFGGVGAALPHREEHRAAAAAQYTPH